MIKRILIIIIILIFFIGCMSINPSGDFSIQNEYIGDRITFNFTEIIISVPLIDSKNLYDNLHFNITAYINPTQTVFGSSTFSVLNIIEKVETRIRSEIYNSLEIKEKITLKQLFELKKEILTITENTFKPYYEKWENKDKYLVEFKISTFYLSDITDPRAYMQRDYYFK